MLLRFLLHNMPPQRFGDWNGNVDLLNGANHPRLGNPQYPYILELMKKEKKEVPRCYSCRKVLKTKKKLFCKDCETKPDRAKSSIGTFVIYTKI